MSLNPLQRFALRGFTVKKIKILYKKTLLFKISMLKKQQGVLNANFVYAQILSDTDKGGLNETYN
jgi:nitrate reductase NapAB chaperone NapD